MATFTFIIMRERQRQRRRERVAERERNRFLFSPILGVSTIMSSQSLLSLVFFDIAHINVLF